MVAVLKGTKLDRLVCLFVFFLFFFFHHFYKGDNLYDFQFAFLHIMSSEKGPTLKGKNLPQNSFLL